MRTHSQSVPALVLVVLTLARRYTRAQNSVGQLLLRGHGCAADPTAAVLWFRKAAAQVSKALQCWPTIE